MNTFYIFLLILVVIVAIDLIWIQFIIKGDYADMIRNIQKAPLSIKIVPGIIVYLLMTLYVLFFVLPFINKNNLVKDILYYGGLSGLINYGVFAFTNYSLLNQWTLKMTLMDTAWGFVLFSLVTFIIYKFQPTF
jgi:uncharacterized membrane protein